MDSKSLNGGDGSKEHPFGKIQEAANLAIPGDEIIVAPGIYRENVNPINSGTIDNRITYRSENKKAAIISGAEEVKNWELHEGKVWKAKIPNALFGESNPFTTLVYGDWYVATIIAHTGDVFLNHKSMYEVTEMDQVFNPPKNVRSWDSEFTRYTWFT
ncbi:MAG TPA: hypothetical protein PLO29_08120, partial [Paludibacter sp.]|nr:hypothetical protein [Paludibacter sp.]